VEGDGKKPFKFQMDKVAMNQEDDEHLRLLNKNPMI